jgi:ubiquitin-conjugating enzyme E2 Z
MSSNPYENEPGYESAKSSEDKQNQKNYVMKVSLPPPPIPPNPTTPNTPPQIRHETLRITIIQRLEEYLGLSSNGTVLPPLTTDSDSDSLDSASDDTLTPFEPFKDLCKRRFLWYYDSYLLAIRSAREEVTDGQVFARMPFEGQGNDMVGKFNYTELTRRLETIKGTLNAETYRWAEEGMQQKKKDSGVAANLQRQYEQVVEAYKRDSAVTLDIELVDSNPFVWAITYFGRPMTNLDGGLFRITLRLSPRFPEEQPRARFETSLFHHRIARDGTPCYSAARSDDVKSHIDGIIEALEEESPPYDPRTMVNPEAAKLYWGTAEERKAYNRLLRRAVQRSLE